MVSSTLHRVDREPRNRTRRVLLVGPPGAGKSTQGVILAKRLGVAYVSSGAVLREEVRRESRIGRRAADYMNMGRLLPDWLMVYALERRLGDTLRSGFVLDGYPRTLQQAETFMRSPGFTRLDRVIELVVPDDELRRRLTRRLRDDDDDQVVESRLRTYRRETRPMLEFFASTGLLAQVDGTSCPEIVTTDLLNLVDTMEVHHA
jgi:adenylate kinase